MVNHPTQLPPCSSFSAQAAASELLPKPAGALMTASRLAGSSDRIAASRGRATSPANRAGTILVARNGSRPLPGRMPVPDARWLERGWIKGSPLRATVFPHSGGTDSGGNVRSLTARRKGRVSSGVSIWSLRASLRGRAQSRSRLMSINNARSGCSRIMECPGRHARSVPRAMSEHDIHGNLRFGPFELSSGARMLRRGEVVLPLGGRALDILIYLAERPGEVVAKRELIDYVWPGVVVEEGSLRVHVAAIRKALGDGKLGNRYIANVQGRGYSFVGSVVGLGDAKTNSRKLQHESSLPARPRRTVG